MTTENHKLTQGRVQVYTGNGKGKTTASLGLCLRAAGHGLHIHVLQFMKGSTVYGELESARKLAPYLTIEQVGRDTFVSRENPDPVDVAMARAGFDKARQLVLSGDYDLIVLDEINCAVDYGLVSLEELKDLIAHKPAYTELVLTGRGAHADIIAIADLVTEMREVKHYFNAGQASRTGIES
ncbi:cob(I)yrinic acid a,c-diamide adenosyltransferase [Geoalkalibacter ferrihydriticus]|uniref:corrinoid adenosyltransferase n=2 Tax=Geoalkalibacter ferrihydriticus TaxID=392333 RepID=A0A0C2DQ60_9BACT|nr:cob(I)yrinic acid a,c-diamide adenosyltransferase [Geoalkalibacter ferrihydriticus]KIH75519.1 cobinamide adenolsyltransferase [Geoalkalibacter ferrihydriticus DSM 17813]SDM88349.1 cob(I)yrinic acid a,c-diamide adenosyltransferase [Geoalkalibacter ferrihydriticus]